MAKRGFLIFIIWSLSIPFRILSIIFEIFNIDNIKVDIEKIDNIIMKYKEVQLNSLFIKILEIAEDRRNNLHYGIDPIAIMRAVKVYVLNKQYQGASTIEQQFVRVISNRYEHKLFRKLREQMLAISICKRYGKRDISKAYLCVAYYGTNLNGIDYIKQKCNSNIKDTELSTIISIITRLKYPEPSQSSEKWFSRYENRSKYIKLLIKVK